MTFKESLIFSDRSFLIGVAGDSGSGKTILTNGIRYILGKDVVNTVSLDDYHKYDRKERRELDITPLTPEANDLDLLLEHVKMLKRGKKIFKPVYDHSTGTFKDREWFEPKKVVILEGLLPFYTEELRESLDFKIYVDPSRKIKRRWKIKRDVGERGYSEERVKREILEREPDYIKFIQPQKIYADATIRIFPSKYEGDEIFNVNLVQKMVEFPLEELNLNIDLSAMMMLSEKDLSLEFRKDEYYGSDVGVITIDGELHHDIFWELEKKLRDFTGYYLHKLYEREEYINAIGLTQLILCWRFFEQVNHLLLKRETT